MNKWNKHRQPFIPGMDPPILHHCEVCGSKVATLKSLKYVVRENVVAGGISSALYGTESQPTLYDAFDCPVCGCQMIAKERLREGI